MKNKITILGIFAVDLTFIAKKLPQLGETVLSEDFYLGPGGKGSNQAVAASRLGSDVSFLTLIGDDNFGENSSDGPWVLIASAFGLGN